MKQILFTVLFFPLDLIYFTLDAGIVSWRLVKRVFSREKAQKNHFCEGEDNGESPHVVRSVLKYQNKWLVKLLAPCITFKSDGKRRIGFCKCHGGYYRAPIYVPLLFVVMVGAWGTGVFAGLRSVSSDPENFGRNFISTFNPSSLREDAMGEMVLERGETRLNPERAERYFLSGIRYLDQQKFANAQVDLKIAIQSNPKDAKLHYNLARAFLGMGQLRQAESSLRQTLELDDAHVDAMLILSELLQNQQKPEEAREFAAKALEIAPENLQAVRLNAGQLANQGDRDAVRPLMDTLRARDGENPDTLSFLARMELGLYQDAEAARERLDAALAIDPDHIPSKLEMINLYVQEENAELIEQTIDEILELDPDHLQAHRLQAEMNLRRYGIPAGIRAYEGLLERFAGNLQFRLRYAELLFRAGRISEAKELADQLTDSRVPAIERAAHWMLAQIYAQARMFENAIAHGQSTLRMAPGAREVHVFLSQNFLNLRRFTEARREAERALALNPLDGQAINLLTQTLVQLDQTDQAVVLLDDLLEQYPDEDRLKLRRVEILLQSPKWREAIPYTRELLEKYPDNPSLKNNLAFLLARNGEHLDEAMSLMDSLPEEMKENPVILDTRAYVMAAQGRHEEAIPLFEEALTKAGGNVTIRFHYALSLHALGRTEEAEEQVEAALMINPDFPQAAEARQLMAVLTSSRT
jgi:tetratricopeptide (TPR) repeat protein